MAAHPRNRPPSALQKVLSEYRLSEAALARMLGVSTPAVAGWENGRRPEGREVRSKLRRVQGLLRKAAGVMKKPYVRTWLKKPNDACAELGARAPIDLLQRGDYEAVEDMLFYLGSGVSF